MGKALRCFQEDLRGKSYTTVETGLRVVEVARITGSVDKCRQLDGRFLPLRRRDRGERQRRARLAAALASDMARKSLPPVSLYRHGGVYYVLDGHRRVAAYREAGVLYVEANVTDVVLQGDEEAVRAAVSRRRFEAETGLLNLRLAVEAGYADLHAQIASWPDQEAERPKPGPPAGRPEPGPREADLRAVDLKAKARGWYSQQFLPACRQIRDSGLLESFPGLREGDLYVLVLRFHRDFDSGFSRGSGFAALLSRFLAAARARRARLRLLGPFQPLRRLFGRRSRLPGGPPRPTPPRSP